MSNKEETKQEEKPEAVSNSEVKKERDYFKVVDTVMEKSSEVEPDKVLSVFGKYKGMVFVMAAGYLVLSIFVGDMLAKIYLVIMLSVSATNMIFNTFGGRSSANKMISKTVDTVAEKVSKKTAAKEDDLKKSKKKDQ